MDSLVTLPGVLAGIMLLALNAYVLLGGADFGGGMWDLFARGPRREEQRALIAHAIGPIWEANHVWLILVVVLLFTCFPPAFAVISTELHIPLSVMLFGVVLRGSAFTFRTYDAQDDGVQRRWGLVFSLSSILTPAALGACIGAIASGAVGRASALGTVPFAARFVAPWANPFVLGVAAFSLALFSFLAAVYLTVEAGDDVGLQRDFRRRALLAGIAVFVCAFGTLAMADVHAPRVMAGVMRSPAALPLQLATGIAAILAFVALLIRRYRLARACRRCASLAYRVGVGDVAVSVHHPSLAHGARCGGASDHVAPDAHRAGGWRRHPRAFVWPISIASSRRIRRHSMR